MTGLYRDLLPEDVAENTRRHRLHMFSPPARITTPILEYVMSKQTRNHLASMDPERLAQLQADWAEGEAANSISEPISADIRERARIEWEQSK